MKFVLSPETRRGGARDGVAAPLTAKRVHPAAAADSRYGQQAPVSGAVGAAVRKPSAGRAGEDDDALAGSAGSASRGPLARSAVPTIVPGHSCGASASPRQRQVPERAPAESTDALARVILIERCSGVQVGRDNDQYSVYRVSIPTAALQSDQALADQLLCGNVPWSTDMFGHDAKPDLGEAVVGFGASSRGLVESPDGETLVIVRNSRGVQIGNHNVQHNEFRIRVADVTVRATGLRKTPARADGISRLRANPGDRRAARALAEEVARAASTELTVDLRAKVASDVGHPQVGWPASVHDRPGIQAGEQSRARLSIQVKVSRLETYMLEQQFRRSAEKLALVTAKPQDAVPWLNPPGVTGHFPVSRAVGRGVGIKGMESRDMEMGL
jgi:RIP homotypic interaction motif